MLGLLKRIRTLLLETIKTMLCGVLCVCIVVPFAIVINLVMKTSIGIVASLVIATFLAGLCWREEIWPLIKELYKDLKNKENDEGD